MISRQKRASIPRAGTPVPEPVTHAARGGSKRAVQAPVPPTRPWEPLNISASMSKSRHALRLIHETCRPGATNDGDKSMKFMLMMNAQRQLFDEYFVPGSLDTGKVLHKRQTTAVSQRGFELIARRIDLPRNSQRQHGFRKPWVCGHKAAQKFEATLSCLRLVSNINPTFSRHFGL